MLGREKDFYKKKAEREAAEKKGPAAANRRTIERVVRESLKRIKANK